MSKLRTHRSTRSSRNSKRFIVSVICAILFIGVASVMLAQWRPLSSVLNVTPLPAVAPLPSPIPPPANPSKEYVYAGGRLLATEEGGLEPPSNLSALLWCSAHLSWRDNSHNETGFKIETLNADGVTWSVLMVLPANTSRQWGLNRIKDTVTYRVRAFNSDGDSAPSNSVTVPGRPVGSVCPEGTPSE